MDIELQVGYMDTGTRGPEDPGAWTGGPGQGTWGPRPGKYCPKAPQISRIVGSCDFTLVHKHCIVGGLLAAGYMIRQEA